MIVWCLSRLQHHSQWQISRLCLMYDRLMLGLPALCKMLSVSHIVFPSCENLPWLWKSAEGQVGLIRLSYYCHGWLNHLPSFLSCMFSIYKNILWFAEWSDTSVMKHLVPLCVWIGSKSRKWRTHKDTCRLTDFWQHWGKSIKRMVNKICFLSASHEQNSCCDPFQGQSFMPTHK